MVKFAAGLGLTFDTEKTTPPTGTAMDEFEALDFAPTDILDYIYAVLHSPSYRETYKEFLKIDFTSVLYPTALSQFRL